ncbi:MAG: four helix bundle protein [Gemmatimonadales bacterium]
MQPFRKLKVWQKAHALTLELYRITRAFPTEERYGLTSQVRRSAASVGANLAEGCVRRTWISLPITMSG